jgi:hypothetical protein
MKYEMAHREETPTTEMQFDPPDKANLALDDIHELFRFAVGRRFRRRVGEFGGGRQRKSARSGVSAAGSPGRRRCRNGRPRSRGDDSHRTAAHDDA